MGIFWELDISQALDAIEVLKKDLSPEEFKNAMTHTLHDTARRSRTIIDKAVRNKYEVKSKWVLSKIGNYKIREGGNSVMCIIPINSDRGGIGSTFRLMGDPMYTNAHYALGFIGKDKAYGRLSGKRAAKAMTITAKIVKEKNSIIPQTMPVKTPYTGRPSFVAKGIAFTRKTDARLPIVPIKGLAVPQMPEQRARPEVEEKICLLMEERFVHYYKLALGIDENALGSVE